MTRVAPIPETVTLHVPFRIVKRGGRKEMRLPDGATQPRRTDNTLVKALARAFRWKRMLESGEFASISELADKEGIAFSYMARILRTTLLAPDIVEAILDGRQRPELTLARVLEPFPVEWMSQGAAFEAYHEHAYLQRIPAFTTHLRRLTAGTKVYATNRKHIASAEILLPEPEEQRAIVRVLSDMDAEITALEARLDKTRALKQGMMQALLTGRVRLPVQAEASDALGVAHA